MTAQEMEWQDQPGRSGYFVTKGVQMDTYTIHRRCPFCGELAHVTVPGKGLWAWEHGEFVQVAFPDLNAEEREMVMTGTHGACWDEAFPEPEEGCPNGCGDTVEYDEEMDTVVCLKCGWRP